jgi:hypothetical protein
MGNSSVATTRGVIEMAYWKAANLFVAVAVLVIGAGGAAAAESRRVAFFGFFLINTSLQPTQPAEEKRLEMLDTFYGINLLVLAGSASLPFPRRYKGWPSPVLEFRIAKDVRGTLPRRLALSGWHGGLCRRSAISSST